MKKTQKRLPFYLGRYEDIENPTKSQTVQAEADRLHKDLKNIKIKFIVFTLQNRVS